MLALLMVWYFTHQTLYPSRLISQNTHEGDGQTVQMYERAFPLRPQAKEYPFCSVTAGKGDFAGIARITRSSVWVFSDDRKASLYCQEPR